MSHVHSIPEITYWSRDVPLNDGGRRVHACYFCKPDLYDPMPRHCTICARCGVFIWTGVDDPKNLALSVCPDCETAIEKEVAS